MRRMYSEKQLQELSLEISQEQINQLAVRKYAPPSSVTLTDEEIAIIRDGCFIEGAFLGVNNPMFCPSANETGTNLYGIIIYGASIGVYLINKSTKIISLYNNPGKLISLDNVTAFNGVALPNYPSSTGTFTFKSVNGVLTWVED